MKQNKAREFWVTQCPDCSGYDTVIEILKSYNCQRDLQEKMKEGRTPLKFTQQPGQKIPFCICSIEEEVDLNQGA